MSDLSPSEPARRAPRRAVLRGVGAGAVAAGLAGCGSTDQPAADQPPTGQPAAGQPPAGRLVASVPVASVPEAGGVVLDRVVVTQPASGEYHAFDATCPHRRCAVAEVTAEEIVCPCHGSRFDPRSGGVLQGPATTGLRPYAVTDDGSGALAVTDPA